MSENKSDMNLEGGNPVKMYYIENIIDFFKKLDLLVIRMYQLIEKEDKREK